MNVTVSSIFRNSSAYLAAYFDRVTALREHVDVRLVLGEGDSTDGTGDLLRAMAGRGDTVLTVNHGGPRFGSVDHPERWANIAQVVRAVIGRVGDPGDAFVWVESDLLWDPDTMLGLLKADRPVAPLVLHGVGNHFYDTWGFRKGGIMFSSQPPYLSVQTGSTDPLVPVDSCGSCFVLPARDFHFAQNWDGMWPFPAGGNLHLDTEAVIRHP